MVIQRDPPDGKLQFRLISDSDGKETSLTGLEDVAAQYGVREHRPRISPDGRLAAWQSSRVGWPRLVICTVTGSDVKAVDSPVYDLVFWSNDSKNVMCFKNDLGHGFSSMRVVDPANPDNPRDVAIAEEDELLSGVLNRKERVGFVASSFSAAGGIRTMSCIGFPEVLGWIGSGNVMTLYMSGFEDTTHPSKSEIVLPEGTRLILARYSNDAGSILFILHRGKTKEIWLADVKDRSVRRLNVKLPQNLQFVEFPYNTFTTLWTADKRWLLTEERGSIYRIALPQ